MLPARRAEVKGIFCDVFATITRAQKPPCHRVFAVEIDRMSHFRDEFAHRWTEDPSCPPDGPSRCVVRWRLRVPQVWERRTFHQAFIKPVPPMV